MPVDCRSKTCRGDAAHLLAASTSRFSFSSILDCERSFVRISAVMEVPEGHKADRRTGSARACTRMLSTLPPRHFNVCFERVSFVLASTERVLIPLRVACNPCIASMKRLPMSWCETTGTTCDTARAAQSMLLFRNGSRVCRVQLHTHSLSAAFKLLTARSNSKGRSIASSKQAAAGAATSRLGFFLPFESRGGAGLDRKML